MDLRPAYDTVLAPSFPAGDLDTYEEIERDLESGRAALLVDHDDSGTPRAVAVLYRLDGADLLGHLAVAREHRSQGIGSDMIRVCLDLSADRGVPLLALIERPDRRDYHPEFGDPKRRIDFYADHGARALDLPFCQPSAKDEARRFGMLLARLDDGDAEGWMDTDPLRRFVADYVGDVDDRDDHDIALRAALKLSRVRLIPLDEYRGILTP